MADFNLVPGSFKTEGFKEHVGFSESAGFSESDGFSESGEPKRMGFFGFNTSKNKFSRSTRIFKWFLLIAFLALVAELIWFLGVTPFRPFNRIEVSGFSYYDRDSLLAYAGLSPRSSFIFTNAKEIESLLADLPQMESVRVFKRYPGRLEIHIQSRQATALAFTDINGITTPLLLDRHGVVFYIGTAISEDVFVDLPVISGLNFEPPYLGTRLPARYFSLFEDLEAIRLNAPELLSAVSEIRFDRNSSEGVDIILYLQHQRNRILLSGLNEELLRYTLLIADVLTATEGTPEIIDFRAVIASYFPRGGSL